MCVPLNIYYNGFGEDSIIYKFLLGLTKLPCPRESDKPSWLNLNNNDSNNATNQIHLKGPGFLKGRF